MATPAEGGPAKKVEREVSVHEAMSKLRRIAAIIGQPVDQWLAQEKAPAPKWRAAVERIAVAIGRAERPRSQSDAFYSWRQLDGEFFRLVREAEKRGEPFAALPTPPQLSEKMGVGLRTLQMSIQKMREELATRPGYLVHVDLWIGAPPENEPGAPNLPRMWVSRWRARSEREAALKGLLPANTIEQAKVARAMARTRLRAD